MGAVSRLSTPPPLFCTVTDDAGHGGIARVSRLAQKALSEIYGESSPVLRLLPYGGAKPTLSRRIAFSVRARMRGSLPGRWTLFDHAGIARAAAGKYGLFLHGIEAWNPDLKKYARAITNADLRIAVSEHTRARVREAHQLDLPIDVVPLALLPEEPSGEVDDATLSLISPKSVGIVARLVYAERRKGHDELILAFRQVVRHEPEARLIIVGDGDDRSRLEDLVEESGLVSHVVFTGRVSEATLSKVYERIAAFAMPSRGEGFGLVYLEAMRKGLPCIASIHDAAKEVIADGETGLLVDHTDPAALVDPILQLLRNPELRTQMGEKGRKREREVFSYERFRLRFENVLRAHALV